MQIENEIKSVMFDLGNVIICFDHMIAARRIAHYCNKDAQEIYNLFFYSSITEQFDSGKINQKEFFRQVKSMLLLNKNLSESAFFDIWNDIFWENPGIEEVLVEIKSKFNNLLIISNVNKPHFEYILKRFPVVGLADEIILSYEVGALKPDPRIYEIASKKSGSLPQETFYTDDRRDLIVAAKELGFKAFLFEGIEALKLQLFLSAASS